MPTITMNHVTKHYIIERRGLFRRGRREIGIQNVDLTIRQGEFVFVIGSSGSGKSTLLRLLSGRERPSQGEVLLNGKPISHLTSAQLRRLPLLIGAVDQQHTLNHRVTVEDNLKQAARIGQRKFKDEDDFEARVKKVLGLTGLGGMERKFPGELTAGERRRVGLSQALINSPPILVLDEVTANLDQDSMWDVFLLLNELNRKGTTIIMSTRNSEYVNMLRRRVITLVDGRIYSDAIKGRYGEAERKNA